MPSSTTPLRGRDQARHKSRCEGRGNGVAGSCEMSRVVWRTNIAVPILTATTGESLTLIFIIIGVLAGILSGLFGIGGGVVIVPALIMIAGLAPIAATGTSLGALLLPVGALGAWEYYRKGQLDLRVALLLALGLFFGAFFGAKVAQMLTAVQLKRAFAIFLVLVAIRVWTAK